MHNYKIVDSSENESYYNIEKIWNLANYLGIKPDYILKTGLIIRTRFVSSKSILEKLLVILKNNYLLNSEEEREIKSARKFL